MWSTEAVVIQQCETTSMTTVAPQLQVRHRALACPLTIRVIRAVITYRRKENDQVDLKAFAQPEVYFKELCSIQMWSPKREKKP